MKRFNSIATMAMIVCLLLSSCETIQNTSSGVKGGVIGTGAGAAAGAGVGALAGNTGLGAVIGAVVGGTAGALIGHKMDKQRKELEKIEGATVEAANNGEAIKVTFDSGILFATGKSDLSAVSKTALSKFAASLSSNQQTNVQIYGHTDNTGGDHINIPLSQQRAVSVQNYLMMQGISTSRITATGRGSSEPVADNSSATGRTQNRRVEIYILANEQMIQEAKQGSLR